MVIFSKGELVIHYSQPYQYQSIVLALVPLIGVISMLVAIYFRRRSRIQARVETTHMPHCETIETSAVAINAEALIQEAREPSARAVAIGPTEEFSEAALDVTPVSEFEETEDEYDILELPPIEVAEEDHAHAHSPDAAISRDCFAAAFIDNPSIVQDAVLDFVTT
jgi:hypothetical protein